MCSQSKSTMPTFDQNPEKKILVPEKGECEKIRVVGVSRVGLTLNFAPMEERHGKNALVYILRKFNLGIKALLARQRERLNMTQIQYLRAIEY